MDEKILSDIRQNYGIDLRSFELINGGWRNQLWKASDGQRDYIVKKYSPKRFSRQKLLKVESALQRQIRLEPYGVPSPRIYLCGQRAIRFLDDDTFYMVMDFSMGWNETPETITPSQMESLGTTCAKIHKGFSQLPDSAGNQPDDIPGLLEEHIYQQEQKFSAGLPTGYQETFLAGRSIFRGFSRGLFDRLSEGFSHEDFTPDNVLFDEKGVTAVIDFDRSCYGFPLHDVGRAVLSFALEADGTKWQMNHKKVQAFIDGYTQYLPLTWADVADALSRRAKRS